MRWGVSPVFIFECLANSRRWQTYAVRSIGVAVLLAAVASIAMSRTTNDTTRPWQEYAALGESYFYAIIGVVLTLVMLAAPAATAGAICVDRARGTLTHMLVTDLSDSEIVLGKLAARLLPILGLVACTWPVLSISSLLGGIDPTAVTIAFLIILAVALLGCSLALALSVWAKKPHEVAMVTYAFWILVLLIWPIWTILPSSVWVGPPPRWSILANPYYLAFTYFSGLDQIHIWEYLGFFAVTLGASVMLVCAAVWRMRPVARRGGVDDRKQPAFGRLARLSRLLPGPSLDRNPVVWREWNRSRPSRWLMALMLLVGGTSGIACLVGSVAIWSNGVDLAIESPGPLAGILGLVFQVIFGLLILSSVAPLSMSEERERGSLDLLAATALSTPAIVIGKWLGSLRFIVFVALGPGLVGFALATAYSSPVTVPPPAGTFPDYYERMPRAELLFGAALLVATIFIHGALIASVGLALATWIKRRSRAIVASVGLAVAIAAGWPIVVAVSSIGMPREGMMCLSPVVAAANLARALAQRQIQFGRALVWIAFWDIECMVLALGLLWVTVRTFDGCFGRMPDRPRRVPVLSDVAVVLAALIGVGCLFGATTIWIKRLGEFRLEDAGLLACAFLVTGGCALLPALAAISSSRSGRSRVGVRVPTPEILHRTLFARRWWQAFRLALALAIGPSLLALALATARTPVRVESTVTSLPGGATQSIATYDTGTTYVATTDAAGLTTYRFASAAEIAAATPSMPVQPPFGFLPTALLAVLTILAHGAALVSLGLALGISVKVRTRAMAASVCLVLIVSLLTALSVLLLNVQRKYVIAENLSWLVSWAAFSSLLAIAVSFLAISTLDRRLRVSLSNPENSPVELPAFDPLSSCHHPASNLPAR